MYGRQEGDVLIAGICRARDELRNLFATTDLADDDAGGSCQLIETSKTCDG
jgi:hypothetical protein